MVAPLHLTVYMHIWTTVNLQWQRKKKCKKNLSVLRHFLFIDIKQQQQKHKTQHQSIKESSEST